MPRASQGETFPIAIILASFLPGVLMLVLVYTVMGTVLFVSLEGDLDEMDGIETAASKPYPRNNDMIYAELRTR